MSEQQKPVCQRCWGKGIVWQSLQPDVWQSIYSNDTRVVVCPECRGKGVEQPREVPE